MRRKPVIFELLEPNDAAALVGESVGLSRIARGMSQKELADESGVSLEAVEKLESSGDCDLTTFLSLLKPLGIARDIFELCQPRPQTLDDLDRLEAARAAKSEGQA